MPEFTPWETDDRVFPELYAERRERQAEVEQRAALFLELDRLQRHEPGEARSRAMADLRARMRDAGIDWPYAYSRPVAAGGFCLECGRSDGAHAGDCEAVS